MVGTSNLGSWNGHWYRTPCSYWWYIVCMNLYPSKSSLCAMLRPLLTKSPIMDETGCAMVILLPWCDFPLPDVTSPYRRRAMGMMWLFPPDVGVSENSVPLNPMVLLIIIPIKWLFHWEYTIFSDKPMWLKYGACSAFELNRLNIQQALAMRPGVSARSGQLPSLVSSAVAVAKQLEEQAVMPWGDGMGWFNGQFSYWK